MKFIALESTIDWKSKSMDIVHSLLFHGDAIRADAPTDPAQRGQDSWSHWSGDDLSHPLLLTRSGVHIPPIFKPNLALVVREVLYQRVNRFPGLLVADTQPAKLINYSKSLGDFSFYDSNEPLIRRNMHRPDMLLDWMPNDQRLFATFPKCYELVACNVFKNIHNVSNTVDVDFTMNNDRETEVHFRCPSSVIDVHPLIWGMVCFVRRDLFDLIQDAVDPSYFAMRPVDI